jgi:hypothetical protein
MAFIDPALKVVSFDQNVKTDSAVDDAGNSWAPDQNNQRVYYGGNNQKSLMYQCQVPLKFPDNAGKKLTSLKFTISMKVGDESDSLSVDKPLEAEETSKELGDLTVTFRSLKKNANGYELKIGMSTANQNTNNLFTLAQTAKLTDANGKSYNNFGGGGGGSNNKLEYTINYGVNGNPNNAPGEPVKWVLEVPTKTHEMQLPVEFSDLPLP